MRQLTRTLSHAALAGALFLWALAPFAFTQGYLSGAAAQPAGGAPPPTPVNPGTTNLVEWWAYDNDTDGAHAAINGIRVGATYDAVNQLVGTHCLEFDGASDQVRTASISDTLHTTDFAAGGWYWLDTVAETEGLLGKWESTTATKQWNLTYNTTSGKLEFTLKDSAAADYTASATYATTGAWAHVVGVRESDTLKIYVNGTLGATTADVTGITENTGAVTYLRLGVVSGVEDLDGKADEIAIWDAALSGGNIAWLFNSGAGRAYTDL